ncbi:hypothetical protein GH733_010871 [Mirounga leonina]|nr:hypothetical protein GH733_010871 [Mirounga leonina]
MLFLLGKEKTFSRLKHCAAFKCQCLLLTTKPSSSPLIQVKLSSMERRYQVCVLNKGMLIYHRPYEKSRLIIEFKLNFPENGFLSPDKLSLLEKLLP